MKQLFIALFLVSLSAGAMDNNHINKLDFSKEQLADYLDRKTNFFDGYKALFMVNHIDGVKFFNLDPKGLKDLGVVVIGHRLRLYGIILKYKQKQGVLINNRDNNN